MIRFDSVGKRYRRFPCRSEAALRDFDLRVGPGECVALVGPNGSGKSTVVGLALGFLRPSAGRIRVGGLPPRRYVRERGVGHLPERYDPPGGLRAERVLARLALLDGVHRSEVRRRCRAALERAGLAGSAAKRVRSLSRGTRQRLGIAQLLLRPRSVLLLDEPWGGLDPDGRTLLRRVLAEVRRTRPEAAVLVASHALDQVARVADRAVVLAEGGAADELDLDAEGDGRGLERRILAIGRGDRPAATAASEPGRPG